MDLPYMFSLVYLLKYSSFLLNKYMLNASPGLMAEH